MEKALCVVPLTGPRQHVTPNLRGGDAGLEPTCTCPKASTVSQRGLILVEKPRPSKGRVPSRGRTAHGRPALPASSWAPATPFIKHKMLFSSGPRNPWPAGGVASGLRGLVAFSTGCGSGL